MASTVYNGTNLLLKFIADGGTLATIGHSTSASLSLSMDAPEATSKDSGGYQEVIAGLRSGEISFEGLVDYTDTQNVPAMATLMENRSKIDWSFGTTTTGDTVFSGEGFITSIETSGEMESAVTYSGTIVTTGSITTAVNS
jgi:predicted secreted protein